MNSLSLLKKEIETWSSHTIEIDNTIKETASPILNNFSTDAKLFRATIPFQRYQHHYIKIVDGNLNYDFEFTATATSFSAARVTFTTLPKVNETKSPRYVRFSPDIKNRMENVLGMRNYSLFLR